MRILFYVNKFPAYSETFIRNQIVGLADQGFQVRILCSRNINRSEMGALKGFESYGLESKTFDDSMILPSSWKQRKLQMYLILFLSVFKGHFKYYKRALTPLKSELFPNAYQLFFYVHFLLKHKIEVVHAHYGNNGLLASVFKKIGLPIKLFTTFHGYDIRLGLNKPQSFYQPLFQMADGVIAISLSNKRYLSGFGLNEEKISLIPNGINLDLYNHRSNDRQGGKVRIISVGRLVKEKGFQYGIRAVLNYKRRYPQCDIEYLILGEGELREALQKIINESNAANYVKLLGNKSSEEVKEAMVSADIYMLSSIVEVLPTVLIEAQACFLPVLATDVGAVKEMLGDGIIVHSESDVALFDGLIKMVNNKANWKQMGEAGRKKVEKDYSIDTVLKKLKELYEN